MVIQLLEKRVNIKKEIINKTFEFFSEKLMKSNITKMFYGKGKNSF